MNLVVPPEIKKEINKYSGYINQDSKYAEKNLKGLFFTNENIKYLSKELYQLITFEPYVKDNIADDSIEDINRNNTTDYITGYGNRSKYSNKVKNMITAFKERRDFINKIIFALIECHPLPFSEDLGILNPVQQLHNVNLEFLLKSSKNIIQNPQNLSNNFNRINPDTNKYEFAENDYDASSYSDGVWHPEHLFTNNSRNRNNPYWLPLEVNIYSDPDASSKQPGHKYNNILYNEGSINNFHNISSFGQFPAWQTTVNKRFYDRENVDGLKDGGLNDRRVQSPHGYNMKSLFKK